MITCVATLSGPERAAIEGLLARVLDTGEPPLVRAFLFGSKARGDDDEASDVDVLVICDVPSGDVERVAEGVARKADASAREMGVDLEPWTVATSDLERGARTPMLVDALDDGVPLWPPGSAPLRLPFTPADARFCADCLLDWVEEGGSVARRALRGGDPAAAARRARDDITRLATAALLLAGETRHRRAGALDRFERRFVRRRILSPRLLPALAWARAAYPHDGGRGREEPPASSRAAASAKLGCRLAAVAENAVVPWVARRLHFPAGYGVQWCRSAASSSVRRGRPASIRNIPTRRAMKR